MTVTVGVFDAKTRLSELVDQVARTGEEVVITRRGRPLARITPINDESAVEEALELLAAARAQSSPGPGTIRELIDDGRRVCASSSMRRQH